MFLLSLPMRGAWIEIMRTMNWLTISSSLPMRGAWIEILAILTFPLQMMSLPMRGAWIEIEQQLDKRIKANVAPHAGSVD